MEKYLIIPSVSESLNKLEFFLEDFFNDLSLERNNYYNILLSLTELVSNSITHGNKLNEDKSVIIKASLENKKICLTVEDEGNGFDKRMIKDPTLPENLLNETGRGFYLINMLADEVNLYENGRIIEIKFETQREHQLF